jgi:hypothetical protein
VRLIPAKYIPELLELSGNIKNDSEIKNIILKSYIKLLKMMKVKLEIWLVSN